MGTAAAIAGIASAVVGGYGASKAAKKQASAANAMADAMENQPEQKTITTETKDISKAADTVNGAGRRRLSLNKTTNAATLGNPVYGSPFKRTTLG